MLMGNAKWIFLYQCKIVPRDSQADLEGHDEDC